MPGPRKRKPPPPWEGRLKRKDRRAQPSCPAARLPHGRRSGVKAKARRGEMAAPPGREALPLWGRGGVVWAQEGAFLGRPHFPLGKMNKSGYMRQPFGCRMAKGIVFCLSER